MNRKSFIDRLEQLALESNPANPISVIMLDIDLFKQYNDNYGHLAGDNVLKEIGKLLQSMSDVTECVGRFGGEEFILALISDHDRSKALAEYLREEISRKSFLDGKITASFGVVTSWGSQSCEDLVRQADQALYSAKDQGRNKVVSHGELMESMIESGDDPDVRDFETKARVLSDRLTNFLTLRTKSMASKLKQKAERDGLTHLYNRMYFDKRISREFEIARVKNRSLALLFLDIDHFGVVNKEFGFLAGDKALIAVATALNDCIRAVDWIARYGGEEFCVIMPDCKMDVAKEVAERIRSIIKKLVIKVPAGKTISVTASIGVGGILKGDESVLSFIQRVSDKTREAKRLGRDRICF